MTAHDSNQLTIKTYNEYVDKYIEQTPKQYTGSRQGLKRWIDTTLRHVKPNGTIFEIGSATPRDANYMRTQGFSVQCSDATPKFVEYLTKCGENAIALDITQKAIPGRYDAVFANAVFPHFTEKNTIDALQNIYESLTEGGILAFNVKQGEDEEWINEKLSGERFIHYWQPHEIYDVVRSCGYDVILLEDGGQGERPTHIWTRIIAQKV